MKRQNSNLIQNYTDSDLQSFTILGKFKNYRSDSIETKNKQNFNQSVGYVPSDNKHFQKLMNFNKNTKISSKEYSIDDFTDNEDLTDKKTRKDEEYFYNESDIQNFKNLKQFPLNSSPDTLLQGMFGQTQGIGSTSIGKSNNTSISEKLNDTNTNLRNANASNKKIIKIVDFDKEKKLREESIQKKIKVKFF